MVIQNLLGCGDLREELCHRDNLNAAILTQRQEMAITCDDVCRVSDLGALQYHISVRVGDDHLESPCS